MRSERNPTWFAAMVCLSCWGATWNVMTAQALMPLPETVAGVERPLRPLTPGIWSLSSAPQPGDERPELNTDTWIKVRVPGELALQGISLREDQAVLYRTVFPIPSDAAGQRLFLRFLAVHTDAIVWVNGRRVGEHQGSFTTWDCDITDAVTPGYPAVLALQVTDSSKDVSRASYDAFHSLAGVLRDVELVTLPPRGMTRLDIQNSAGKAPRRGRHGIFAR